MSASVHLQLNSLNEKKGYVGPMHDHVFDPLQGFDTRQRWFASCQRSCGRLESRPHRQQSSPWSQPQTGGVAGSPTEVQLQLVRYDGLPGLTLQLQGIEHVLETRSAPRRPDGAPRRPTDATAYADLALAGAASAPFHPQACADCAKAGAANAMANATAAISVFMVSLHQTHLR